MSQIIQVKTEIRNFKPLERAYGNLGYKKVSGDERTFTIEGNGLSIDVSKTGEFYGLKGDSDFLYRRSGNVLEALQNEYAKEEALAWAKYTGKTVLKVTGDAVNGYDIELSAGN